MLHPSHLDPSMLAYKAVHGPYNWNHLPLAPPNAKPYSTKLHNYMVHGQTKAPTHGMSGYLSTTINAFITLFLKPKLTMSRALPNYFPITAKYRSSCGMSICIKLSIKLSRHSVKCCPTNKDISYPLSLRNWPPVHQTISLDPYGVVHPNVGQMLPRISPP